MNKSREIRLHSALRAKMAEYDVPQRELADGIGKCLVYVNQRFNASNGAMWTLTDVYRITCFLGLLTSQIAEYFPDYSLTGCCANGNGKERK
jgi:hypothetical protein